jgi:hypothetical protein
MKQKLYLHRQGQAETELIEVEETVTVMQLIAEYGEEGHSAWAQDGDELVITALVIEVVEERGHVHIGPHREVDVTVRYETGDKSKEFKPGTRVLTVKKWAVGEHGFSIPEGQRSGLGLFLRGSREPLDEAEHIGVLAEHGHLHLTLQPVKRPQG